MMRSEASAGFTGPTEPAFAPVTSSTIALFASSTLFAPRNRFTFTSFTSRSPGTHTITGLPSTSYTSDFTNAEPGTPMNADT